MRDKLDSHTHLVGVQTSGSELPRNKFRVRSEELVAAGGRDEDLVQPRWSV